MLPFRRSEGRQVKKSTMFCGLVFRLSEVFALALLQPLHLFLNFFDANTLPLLGLLISARLAPASAHSASAQPLPSLFAHPVSFRLSSPKGMTGGGHPSASALNTLLCHPISTHTTSTNT
jgi:hypothetical protein